VPGYFLAALAVILAVGLAINRSDSLLSPDIGDVNEGVIGLAPSSSSSLIENRSIALGQSLSVFYGLMSNFARANPGSEGEVLFEDIRGNLAHRNNTGAQFYTTIDGVAAANIAINESYRFQTICRLVNRQIGNERCGIVSSGNLLLGSGNTLSIPPGFPSFSENSLLMLVF